MKIEVLRIGQRLVRDDRVTTHVALVSRAFGASKIIMHEVNPEIKPRISEVNRIWGGNFEVEITDSWRKTIKTKKEDLYKIVHLTMYGESVDTVFDNIRQEEKILVVVGAEKVPRDVYEVADFNVAIGNQPHSEISALAVLLDRLLKGKQFLKARENAKQEIIPSKKGKKVIDKTIN